MIGAGALVAALLAAPAVAQTVDFTTPIAGTGPVGAYAMLNVEQTGSGDDWVFTLTAGDLGALLGVSGAFLGSIAVDVGSTSVNFGSGLSMSDVGGGGVASVTAKNGGGPGGAFDFRFDFGGGQDRLTSGETVTWTWNDSGFTSFADLALHVQGLEGNPNGFSGSLWVGSGPTPPIPEPASVAMMLAGLGLLGATARRRAQGKG